MEVYTRWVSEGRQCRLLSLTESLFNKPGPAVCFLRKNVRNYLNTLLRYTKFLNIERIIFCSILHRENGGEPGHKDLAALIELVNCIIYEELAKRNTDPGDIKWHWVDLSNSYYHHGLSNDRTHHTTAGYNLIRDIITETSNYKYPE